MAKTEQTPRRPIKRSRCAIYTRKSTDEGLEQAFNSLDAQREACAAFILSQKHEGWTVLHPSRLSLSPWSTWNDTVPWFGPRLRCERCGHLGADARPNWNEMHS